MELGVNPFDIREGVYTKEDENICNLPKLATIELHKSNKTGHYYLTFIEHVSGWNEGRWQDQEINEDIAKMLMAFCYPEHVYECYKLSFKVEEQDDF